MIDVMARLRPIGDAYRQGDSAAALGMVQDVWAELPEPASHVPNAYLLVEYGVRLALELGSADEAQVWADRASAFATVRQDRGEVEFLMGKVAFAKGELDVARELIRTAQAKSQGRMLIGEDEKYRQLIK
jgi:hypothetical protein